MTLILGNKALFLKLMSSGGGASSTNWGQINGTLSSQTDLQTALNAKQNTITAGTISQYYRGDKTWQTLNKTAVGLSNVDNTSDLNKPMSFATQDALYMQEEGLVALIDNATITFKADLNLKANTTDVNTSLDLKEDKANKGVAGGYAELDNSGKVPSSQLPSIASSVSTLSDVALANLSSGEVLVYNSSLTKWENKHIGNLSSNTTSGELTPIGSIIAYYGGGEIPEGWLLCDGSEFDTTEYPLLHNFLNSHILPDLRGYFLRGLGGVDPEIGRTIGSIQEDEFKSHQHELPLNMEATILARIHHVLQFDDDSGTSDNGFNPNEQTKQVGGEETRPKNVAVNYIIKSKHIATTNFEILAGSEDIKIEHDTENQKIHISLSSPLSSKANTSDVYTKDEVDSFVIDAGLF